MALAVPAFRLRRLLPILEWLPRYRREDLTGDVIAGVVVAIVLVPQSMAYALLAGLPPEMGLYAGIVPLFIYGLVGTSMVLAVGPTAISSLLVASTLVPLIEPGSAGYVGLAVVLTFMAGVIRLLLGAFRMGWFVRFLSHPVLTGFTHAAALIIVASQLKILLGISIPSTERFTRLLFDTARHVSETNLATLGIGLGSIGVLLFFSDRLAGLLGRWGMHERLSVPLVKAAPLLVVIAGTIVVWAFALSGQTGVKVVGAIPSGLPSFASPSFGGEVWRKLLLGAIVIAMIGYIESISVAKALAARRRQRVDPNQELVALGAANLASAVTGGYTVSGSFSRTLVNFATGANTMLASMITGVVVLLAVLVLAPSFFFLPQAVLASIIIVAVMGLIDVRALRRIWVYSKADAASLAVTFFSVLLFGVEEGLVVGVVSAIVLYLARTSRPRMTVVGQINGTQFYGSPSRHEVTTCPHVIALRIDESLYFANTKSLEDSIFRSVAEHPDIKHLVLIGSGINSIDSTGLETLERLVTELRASGVDLHLAQFHGPVLDRLREVGFLDRVGADHVFIRTHDAMQALDCV